MAGEQGGAPTPSPTWARLEVGLVQLRDEVRSMFRSRLGFRGLHGHHHEAPPQGGGWIVVEVGPSSCASPYPAQ